MEAYQPTQVEMEWEEAQRKRVETTPNPRLEFEGTGLYRPRKLGFFARMWRRRFPRWDIVDEGQWLGGRNGISIICNDRELTFIFWNDIERAFIESRGIKVPEMPPKVLAKFCQLTTANTGRMARLQTWRKHGMV